MSPAPFEAATQEHAQELVSDIQEHGVEREPATAYEDWKAFADKAAEKPESAEGKKQSAVGAPKADAKPTKEKADSEPKGPAKPEGEAGKKEPEQSRLQPLTPQQAAQQANDRFLERASREEDYEGIIERANQPYFPMSKEGWARYNVLAVAIQEVSNPSDVLFELARNKQIAYDLQTATPGQIAATVHKISARLRFGITDKPEAPKNRPAPTKPPAEVGGRGATHGDAAVAAAKEGNFKAFEADQNRRFRSSR